MDSKELALKIRISALHMTHAAGASHIGSALSQADLLAVLYSGGASVDPSEWGSRAQDAVIVSKGHAVASVYAALAHRGFFPLSWLDTFCEDGSSLSGHVTSGVIPGVEFSSGSLGHGLGFGIGLALAARLDGQPRRTFVIMSDGECDEGSVWESALLASQLKLDNLIALIDRNGLQSFRSTEDTLALEPLDQKWRDFGWSVDRIDGHDHEQIRQSLAVSERGMPRMVIADTTKGHGVSFMENQVAWHYKSLNSMELDLALAELGAFRA